MNLNVILFIHDLAYLHVDNFGTIYFKVMQNIICDFEFSK